MPLTFVTAFRHRFSPREDEAAARSLAEVLTQPAMRALSRTFYRVGDKDKAHEPATPDTLFEHLRNNEEAHAVGLDSGRTGAVVATALIELGLPYTPDPDVVAPLLSHAIVPFEAAQADALVDVAVGMANALRPVWGFVSVEASYDDAQLAVLAKGPRKDERASRPLMTDDRIRYRRAPWYFDKKIDSGIGGPEWGTFLGVKHLERISLEALRASEAFAEVRALPYGGAFLRLSENPLDAQSNQIVAMVERARAGLQPIILDVSAVKL